MIEAIIVILSVIAALAMIIYATWLFGHQLRGEESKAKGFRQWLKNIFEAIWGL